MVSEITHPDLRNLHFKIMRMISEICPAGIMRIDEILMPTYLEFGYLEFVLNSR